MVDFHVRPKIIGPAPSADQDIAVDSYLDSLLAANLNQTQVDALIAVGLSDYATHAYVDQQDALNATEAQIDTLDAAKLTLAARNANSGYAGLDATGKVDYARVSGGNTQRFPKPFTTPASYNGGTVNATTETTLYPCSIADPGFTYKLLCFGIVDSLVSVDNGEYPLVRVRVGNETSGTIIGTGAGVAERYSGAVQTVFTSSGTYTVPAFATTIDVVLLGAGAGGEDGGILFQDGASGRAGSWASATLTSGVTFTGGSISVTVGTGGSANGGAGGASSISASGYAGLTAAGGSGSGNSSPGNLTYAGTTYVGGSGGSQGHAGNPPGGGGGGGKGGFIQSDGPGGPGANGQVWFYARPINPDGSDATISSGCATIVPTALSAQSPLTGATTVYVRLVRSGSSATVSATNSLPGLYLMPVPA
jgi:hypothetical protein